ncbi:hypothetical protein EJJ20_31545 [Pseudomonas poae]|nr:hypothetical protein EJJ20_31545 [Pseudomonas poae]
MRIQAADHHRSRPWLAQDPQRDLTDTTQKKCGSWLACDADTSVFASHCGDAIAGKPAPT